MKGTTMTPHKSGEKRTAFKLKDTLTQELLDQYMKHIITTLHLEPEFHKKTYNWSRGSARLGLAQKR